MTSTTIAASRQYEMRDHALGLALRGFRVFKLKVNGKAPVVQRFFDVASSDPSIVRDTWTDANGESLHNNIGILTGEGFFVLDVDVKGSAPGLKSLECLEMMGLCLETQIAETPTGGLHIYYALPEGAEAPPNSVSKVMPGIDVRGHHGYVVGPGSIIDGKRYVWKREVRFLVPGSAWSAPLVRQ